ncbi:MAG: hypothetical protein HYT87_19785 [Nitrospirae bacterium]|nr:hypothetical protein [Nitrospirota bacterium]
MSPRKPVRFRVAASNGEVRSEYLLGCLSYEDMDGDGWGTQLAANVGPCPSAISFLKPGDCNDKDSNISPGNKTGNGTDCTLPIVAVLPYAKAGLSCAGGSKGMIYCFGGMGSAGIPSSEILEFDPDSKRVNVRPARLPSGRSGLSCVSAVDRLIYCFGGDPETADIIQYDPSTDTADRLSASLPSKRAYLSCASSANGNVYCFGGDGSDPQVVEFDPRKSTVEPKLSQMPSKITGQACSPGDGNKIYCFGGDSLSEPQPHFLDWIREYNPDRNEVKMKSARLPDRWFSGSCAGAGVGIIYCLGGVLSGPNNVQFIKYDANTDSVWSRFSPITSPRSSLSCSPSVSGKIYCFGGLVPGKDGYVQTDEIVEFDPKRFPLAPERQVSVTAPMIFSGESPLRIGDGTPPLPEAPAFGCSALPFKPRGD